MSYDVKGKCPGCGHAMLFIASGGYVTCRLAECPDPSAASDLLLGKHASVREIVREEINEAIDAAINRLEIQGVL